MAKIISKSLQRMMKVAGGDDKQKQLIIEARVNEGMITSIDPADIPTTSLQSAKNTRVRLDKTSVRYGTILLTPAKPNSQPVMKLYSMHTHDGSSLLLRFTPIGVHKRLGGSWQALSGALTGTIDNKFSVTTAFNQCVFSNGGHDPIQQIDVGLATISNLGNAPRYRLITAFYNRIIGFDLLGTIPDPTQMGWSGDGNITEWDPLNDFSAGSTPLVESPSDSSDFITGGVGLSSAMIILRQKSIWLATKQPVATEPFNLFTAVPGKGCTAPYSVAVVPGGLVWVDPRTQRVYSYKPGQQEPDSIGTQIEKSIFSAIEDPNDIFASYDPREDEYMVAIPHIGTNTVQCWVRNMRTNAWSYDERELLTCIGDEDVLTAPVTIGDLQGTIGDLQGTIGDLGGVQDSSTTKVFGFSDGEIEQESKSVYDDSGQTFQAEIISKNFYLPVETSGVVKLKFEFEIITPVAITLSFSKDAGKTWIEAKTVNYSKSGPQLFIYQRHIRARKLTWKITSSRGVWELIDYEVHPIPAGETI